METHSTYYASNTNLLEELKKYKEVGKMSEELGKIILDIATHLASKSNFSGYTWRDDLIAEACLTCCKYLHKFDIEKSNSAFAYVTQICKNSFIAYLNSMKKAKMIKNELYNSNYRDYHSSINNSTGINYTDLK